MPFNEEDCKDETLKSKIARHLECPVCLHIPDTSPVFQCNNGHIICCRCRVKLNKCPVCRAPLGYSRSLTSEKLISLLSLANNEDPIDETVRYSLLWDIIRNAMKDKALRAEVGITSKQKEVEMSWDFLRLIILKSYQQNTFHFLILSLLHIMNVYYSIQYIYILWFDSIYIS